MITHRSTPVSGPARAQGSHIMPAKAGIQHDEVRLTRA